KTTTPSQRVSKGNKQQRCLFWQAIARAEITKRQLCDDDGVRVVVPRSSCHGSGQESELDPLASAHERISPRAGDPAAFHQCSFRLPLPLFLLRFLFPFLFLFLFLFLCFLSSSGRRPLPPPCRFSLDRKAAGLSLSPREVAPLRTRTVA